MEVLPGALAPMASYRQFIVCLFVPNLARPGKTEKFPVDWRTGEVANAHDPAVWLSHEEAITQAALRGPGHGVGFVVTPAAGFFFLDIDGCLLPTGEWSPLAVRLCQMFAGAAVEVSHSGRGLHIFGRYSRMPAHRCKNTQLHLELYHEGRFVALGTGAQGDASLDCTAAIAAAVAEFFPPHAESTLSGPDWREGPIPEWSGPTDDAELIARALRHTTAASVFGSRASFRDLWENNEEALSRAYPSQNGDTYDRSSADGALASHLAYFTGNDHARVLRLMHQSALVRSKWDRDEYLTNTVSFSVGRQQRVLQDRPAPLTGAAAAVAGPPSAPAPLQVLPPGSFAAAASGVIQASLMNVIGALRSAEGGVTLGYDSFLDRITLGGQALRDVDYVKLRLSFEERGFKNVPADIMRDAVRAVAYDNTYDSLLDWASSLVWDGQPRVETALSVYFGCEDTRYTRAVSRYLFTALAGRALDPGCQADMALIFVGGQGERKTHAVRALAPVRVAFGNADLGKVVEDDGVSARRIRGKAVVELGELRGLASRDDETVKEWVSRRDEVWTPKFVEFETIYPRRCVLIGTSNRVDLLTDPTGNRRWLPTLVGHMDDVAIERDRDQLWAEGVALWRAQGIAWQEAEHLAMHEHDEFRQVDPWEPIIEEWLALPFPPAPGEVPSPTPKCAIGVTLRQIAEGPLKIAVAHLSRREGLRIGKVMRALNYEKHVGRVNGAQAKVWRRSLPFLP